MNLLEKYKKYFPEIDWLYDYQENVLKLLSENRNALAVIPTGGGKSLIFQLRALEHSGITIVVSPLLALMSEHVDYLNQRNIKSLAFNSNIDFTSQCKILRNLKTSDYKIIYVSPERLQNTFFRASLIASEIEVSMIVIDEAHCISQWGSEFRPEYSQIPDFIEFLRKYTKHNIQIMACTATLSKKMREDIAHSFNISKNQIYVHINVLRDNLNLKFEKIEKEKDKPEALLRFLKKNKPDKTLVYLYSRRKSEVFCKDFADDYTTAFYHSSLDKTKKNIIHEDFRKGKYEILFTTTAFGMGVHIPDINAVVQIQIPSSIEEYYQQVGRGWRNKSVPKICDCLAIWSDKNFTFLEDEFKKNLFNDSEFDRLYKKFVGSKKIIAKGQIINIATDTLLNASDNLRLFRFKLQSKKIIDPIAEVNGSPSKIKLKIEDKFWKEVQKIADEFDTFTYVAEELKMDISEIFDYIFEQQRLGNVQKIPGTGRDFFFKVNYVDIPPQLKTEIIKEMNEIVDYKIKSLYELKSLFESESPEQILKNKLE